MSDDISQLIGRLRSYARSSKGDIFAAVDTIEALRAERDRLKDEVERLRNEKVAGGPRPEAMGGTPPATDPAPAVCEWASIETAPTDGTLICGAWMSGRRWATRVLYWNGHDWECPLSDGYYEPTHWMPLPPPESKE